MPRLAILSSSIRQNNDDENSLLRYLQPASDLLATTTAAAVAAGSIHTSIPELGVMEGEKVDSKTVVNTNIQPLQHYLDRSIAATGSEWQIPSNVLQRTAA